MPPVTRLGDIGSGHAGFPPTAVTEGSDNVFVNGKSVARLGDKIKEHGHLRKISKGSGTVFINGKPVARLGDPIDCGGFLLQGSGNVFAG